MSDTVKTSNMQTGSGSATTTQGALVGIAELNASKGVLIKNTDATNTVWLGTVAALSATNSFTLAPGEQVFLEIDNVWDLQIRSNTSTATYTYVSY